MRVKRGRPSKYRPEFVDLAFKFCLLGADNEALAKCFEVSKSQVDNWRKKYPEFQDAIKRGKEQADAVVADSLFHRARGYEHPSVKIFQHEGASFEHEFIEHYPPDTAACIFWLKNRQPDKWRETQNQLNILQISGAPNSLLDRAREVASERSKIANCGVKEPPKQLPESAETPQEEQVIDSQPEGM